MQALTRVADALCQFLLNKHMDILGLRIEQQRAALQIAANAVKTIADRVGVGARIIPCAPSICACAIEP